MNVRWWAATGSTYQRISLRSTRLIGANTSPRTRPRSGRRVLEWTLGGHGPGPLGLGPRGSAGCRRPPILRAPGAAGRLRTSSFRRAKIAATSRFCSVSHGASVFAAIRRRVSPRPAGRWTDLNLGAELACVRLAVVRRREGGIDPNLEAIRSLRRREGEGSRRPGAAPSRSSKRSPADRRRPVQVAEEADVDASLSPVGSALPNPRARPGPAGCRHASVSRST